MEWVAKGDPGEAVSIQAPWATFYGARNNELSQRKTGNRIRPRMGHAPLIGEHVATQCHGIRAILERVWQSISRENKQ
jgi:hypothetical protein